MKLMQLFLQNCEVRLIEFAKDYERSNVFWFLEEMKIKWERG